jgi:hypothetical protein
MSRRKLNGAWIDEGPASARVSRQTLEGKVALLTGLPDRELGEGAGAIERRQITQAEIDARRSTVVSVPRAVPAAAPLRVADPTDRDHQEEPVMPELREPIDGADLVGDALTAHAAVVEEAREARVVYVAERLRWEAAQAALASSYPLPLPSNIPETIPVAAPKRRRPGGEAERKESVEERAARVMAALARHSGDTKAAGAELGMRGNAVARIAQAARARRTA